MPSNRVEFFVLYDHINLIYETYKTKLVEFNYCKIINAQSKERMTVYLYATFDRIIHMLYGNDSFIIFATWLSCYMIMILSLFQ